MANTGFGEFCWYELSTPNVQKAKEFYSKVLGWTFSDTEVGDMTYTMIHGKNKEFGGMWEIPTTQKDSIQPHWLRYIEVEDLQAKLTLSEQLGAVVKMPITSVGTHGRFAVIVDPTGAQIAFWESVK